ncbi:serine/threonine protein kinase [Calidifontibacter sp. DB0510]|uniref:non-specific serine/threonine protein kinase n=1 Tax=Metallococcus carri TaxID=1656884 RepID=A0A967B837_9MICO|nr:serine/threonine-protein kinase [Metallococcus carri]NHN56516.1 serine/threonine protein kinase [Metallococcus carri]NOP38815.1 serine/threonine protein kinase [Calidifontibacter sp. DB2511S]
MGEIFAGRYELIDQIGEGGMGGVWRAADLRDTRIVAAKVLRQSDAGSLLRFMREQGMRIHHPNVVTPLGWAGADDRVLLTMELVEGGSVADLTKQHRALPPLYVAELLRQLLEGLAAVHEQRVVHRDVKPANLLLSPTGTGRPHLWLTDFGIAISMDAPRLTSSTLVMGTPGYIPPEQMRGYDPEPRQDLYAAGMVGLQLLTGHKPRAQVRDDRGDLPPMPPGTPAPLWELLVDLADPDPAGRPPTALAAVDRLNHPSLAWRDQRDVDVRPALPPLGESAGDFVAHARTRTLIQGGGRRRTIDRRKIAMVAAPLAAVAALLAIWLPGGGPSGTPGQARLGANCSWSDVGTTEPDQNGVERVCAVREGTYLWSATSD